MQNDTEFQDEFDKFVEEWKKMDRTTDDKKKAASTFYDEKIFPLVKKVFLNKPENCLQREYDALILTVGTSPEPLILSILAINPNKVGLLYTLETEEYLPRIQQETGLNLNQLAQRQVDGSNTIEMYKTIMDIYADWDNPVNIAVDITGGKKSMVSSAAMAGAILGSDIYYVDNNDFINELRKPEPGSEYLRLLDNPYAVFGDLEVEKARGLYNRHEYAGAQRIFEQLKGVVGDTNKFIVCEGYSLLCSIYETWENLDFEGAIGKIDQLLEITKRFSALGELIELRNFTPKLIRQKTALGCLLNIADDKKLALDISEGFHFAFMLYHWALRLENREKLDMACLLFYRLLEWIGQHRLAQYGIDSSKPDYSNSECSPDELFKNYETKREGLYKNDNRKVENLPNPIALIDGFLVLYALDDKIVEDLNWGALRGQVEMRNKNIFAHGINKISTDNYEKFKSTVEERFKKAQALADTDADTFNEQHKFITPLP